MPPSIARSSRFTSGNPDFRIMGWTVAAAGARGQPRRRGDIGVASPRPRRRSTPPRIRPTLRDMARAVILTGERGAGKTMLCLALAALSPRYVGLVSPPLLDRAGNRVGFAARCLATGGEWVLGRSDAELDGPRFGRFSFSSAGISHAVDCLRGILSRPPSTAPSGT